MNPFMNGVAQFGMGFQNATGYGCPSEVRMIVNAFMAPGTPPFTPPASEHGKSDPVSEDSFSESVRESV